MLTHFFHSFADQAGNWFIGVVLALLGVFSGRLAESIKFALNRADLRTKYYEELATNISHFVFMIDRLVRVSYGSSWASDDDKSAIANEYNETMNEICRKEYVYLMWLNRYWPKKEIDIFRLTMQKIKAVDTVLINLNEIQEHKNSKQHRAELNKGEEELKRAFQELQDAAQALLVQTM
jgi:hypothetical protein